MYELAHKALADDSLSEASRRDITLSLVAAHCNAARDLFQEEKVGSARLLGWQTAAHLVCCCCLVPVCCASAPALMLINVKPTCRLLLFTLLLRVTGC